MKKYFAILLVILLFSSISFSQANEPELVVNNEYYILYLKNIKGADTLGYYAFGGKWGSVIDLRSFYCEFNIPDSSIITLKLCDHYKDTLYVIYNNILAPNHYYFEFHLGGNNLLITETDIYYFIFEAQNLDKNKVKEKRFNAYKNKYIEFKSKMAAMFSPFDE